MDAAVALAELRLRRDQIAAEHARPRPPWRLPLAMALAFGTHAVRELEGRPVKRPLSAALTVAGFAEMLPAPGERRVESSSFWLKQTVPELATDDARRQETLPTAAADDARRKQLAALADRDGPRGLAPLLLGAMLLTSLLPRWLTPRLERHGVRHPQLATGAFAAFVLVPIGELARRAFQRGYDPARTLPDVGAAATFPPGLAPRPRQAPLLRDPALLSLAALLAPAHSVSRSLLRELLAVDDTALAERLRALDAAGWLAPSGRSWRDPHVGLTPEGRHTLAAHAAWLRTEAAPPPPA